MKEIVEKCKERDFTAIIVLNDDHGFPSMITSSKIYMLTHRHNDDFPSPRRSHDAI